MVEKNVPEPGLPPVRPGLRPGELTLAELTDGRPVHLRLIRPDDAARLQRFHDHLSQRSIYSRFFGILPHLGDQQARRFAEVDNVDRLAIVAISPEAPDELIGVTRFERSPGSAEGELAIVLADSYQRRGLGKILLYRLIDAARERGLSRLFALTLSDNLPMIRLLHRLGYPYSTIHESGMERIVLDLTPRPAP